MAKADAVAAAIQLIQDEQAQALTDGVGSAYDVGVADQKAVDGSTGQFTQNDIDNAVAAAIGPLNEQISALTAQDALDVAAAQAAQAQVVSVQAALDAMTAQDMADKAVVANFQSSIAALQAALDALKAALPQP